VLVPKATMHKDHFSAWPEDQVRLARQVLSVESIPVPKPMDELPHHKLRSRIPALDASHVLAALRDRNAINHR